LEWSNYFKCGYKVRHFLSVSVSPSVISWSLKQVIIKGYA
jgi:hypothetical protein